MDYPRDGTGRLTLDSMKRIISDGGSVHLNGIAITKVADLPTQAALTNWYSQLAADAAARATAQANVDSATVTLNAATDPSARATAQAALNAATVALNSLVPTAPSYQNRIV